MEGELQASGGLTPALHESLKQIQEEAKVLSDAYNLRMRPLWWANLLFVVVPAALATGAAALAAGGSKWVAATCAGGAAVLTAIHKALKCDEYQADCLRLIRDYRKIEILAGAFISGVEPGPPFSSPEQLIQHYAEVSGTIVSLPDKYKNRAAERYQPGQSPRVKASLSTRGEGSLTPAPDLDQESAAKEISARARAN